MVYRSEKSASPPLRELSRSPPPEAAANAGPSQRRGKLTFADKRRMEVEKLLSNPDRQVALPQATKEKTLRAPQELVKNVQPTASAAGSGEFHVYKHARRREAERLKIMDDKAKALEEQAEFQARQQAWDAEADAKTAKNRAKRQKRKQGRKGGGAGGGGGEDDDGRGNGATGEPKRKLAGGGASVPAKPTEDGEGEGDNGVAGRPALRIPVPGDGVEGVDEDEQGRSEAVVAEAKARAIETSIVIRDDD